MAASDPRTRRVGGWGFEGVAFEVSAKLLAWLEEHVGRPTQVIRGDRIVPPAIAARSLPGGIPGEISTDAHDRLAHARGQGLVDIIRVRSGTLRALPDGVFRPTSAEQVQAALAACERGNARVIPWGGGTSVVGGVNVLAGDPPMLSMDLERMAGLTGMDQHSGLATFAPGTTGPAVESALAEYGLTLGHFPQSWELATVGGWVATRSSGQESLGYGRIEDMVAGLEVVAPVGRWRLPVCPASAAGPDLRQLVMGSEGRLGVITEATLRVRPRPQHTVVEAALIPDFVGGLEATRDMLTHGIPLTMLRLSDAPETQVAMAVGLASSSAAPLVRAYLRLRRLGESSCLVLYGAAGDPEDTRAILGCARALLRRRRVAVLGRGPGRRWLRDRFRHPYLRESLLDLGYATDTLETAVPWSAASATRQKVNEAISSALEKEDERVAVLCHVSHPYVDGASLYFTFFFRCTPDPDQTVARWATIKRAANDALVKCGATISHHHGVGQWHAPWLEPEIGAHGRAVISEAASRMDPEGVLNPHVLLETADRLED